MRSPLLWCVMLFPRGRNAVGGSQRKVPGPWLLVDVHPSGLRSQNPQSSTGDVGMEQSQAGEDSPIETTGSCLSTGLEVKLKSGAFVTAFWQGAMHWGVRGPQMDALKEGRCLLCTELALGFQEWLG